MRRIFLRSVVFCLLLALGIGGYAFVRAYGLYQSTVGGFEHIRYLLESGESIEGAEAEDVLSDSYLLSLFGDNPELVDRLKTVVDLGMATDANLKLGSVSAMIVTYRKNNAGEIKDAAIYAIGGFPNPKSKRLGFHSTGYMRQELSPELWLSGKSLMNLLGRDVIVFCEQDKAEEHMALLFDLLNGGILPLAERIVEAPLYYAIVFPDPKELAPPNLRNNLQTVIIKGEMGADSGRTEVMLISPNYRTAKQVHTVVNDMANLARITFHDKFGGYIKEVPWGTMNDTWWSVEYVSLIDSLKIAQDQVLVVASVDYNRIKNNAILKTIERAGRDLAMQKSFSLAGDLPWEFAFRERANPSGGYWSAPHRWGPEWPLGDEGIPTPGSIAAAAEREKADAQKEEAAAERKRLKKMNAAPTESTSGPST